MIRAVENPGEIRPILAHDGLMDGLIGGRIDGHVSREIFLWTIWAGGKPAGVICHNRGETVLAVNPGREDQVDYEELNWFLGLSRRGGGPESWEILTRPRAASEIRRGLLLSVAGFREETGVVMVLEQLKEGEPQYAINRNPGLKEVYELLIEEWPWIKGQSFEQWRDSLWWKLRRGRGFIYAAEGDGRCIGVGGVLNMGQSHAVISMVVTHPQFRKQGVAGEIVGALCRECRRRRLNPVLMSAGKETDLFYGKLGFVSQGEWTRLYNKQ